MHNAFNIYIGGGEFNVRTSYKAMWLDSPFKLYENHSSWDSWSSQNSATLSKMSMSQASRHPKNIAIDVKIACHHSPIFLLCDIPCFCLEQQNYKHLYLRFPKSSSHIHFTWEIIKSKCLAQYCRFYTMKITMKIRFTYVKIIFLIMKLNFLNVKFGLQKWNLTWLQNDAHFTILYSSQLHYGSSSIFTGQQSPALPRRALASPFLPPLTLPPCRHPLRLQEVEHWPWLTELEHWPRLTELEHWPWLSEASWLRRPGFWWVAAAACPLGHGCRTASGQQACSQSTSCSRKTGASSLKE